MEGAKERTAAFWDGRSPICICGAFYKAVYSECSINKQIAACSATICCCTASYFLLLSNLVNIICFDQGRTVELSSPEYINLFQPLDGFHRSAKHLY